MICISRGGCYNHPPLSAIAALFWIGCYERDGRKRPAKVPPAGQLLFWGRTRGPALQLGIGRKLLCDPSLGPFRAFGEVQQVIVAKAAGIAPIAVLRLVRACQVDGEKAVVVPNGGRNQADFEFVCWC